MINRGRILVEILALRGLVGRSATNPTKQMCPKTNCPDCQNSFVVSYMNPQPSEQPMSESNQNGYVVLSSSDEWYKQLSSAELQKIVAANKAWIEQLLAQGKFKGGQALVRTGAIITGNNERRVILDGPFAESKEAIGGTLILDVATMAEAIAIVQTAPSLAYNNTMEIRPIGDDCPITTWAREKLQQKQFATAGV